MISYLYISSKAANSELNLRASQISQITEPYLSNITTKSVTLTGFTTHESPGSNPRACIRSVCMVSSRIFIQRPLHDMHENRRAINVYLCYSP
uniref:Uncharacterized protein n=1 Tax=Lepeophtheirus salmonis TaxID=72036 RepID=A0A0K2U9N4_LEPSM